MKKLYVSIDDVHIKGSVLQLAEVITSIDDIMQSISQETEAITSLVLRYSASNSGQQYARMATSLIRMRDFLYEASIQLNEIQNELAEYQTKVMRYEEVRGSSVLPKKFIVQRTRIDLVSKDTEFKTNDMIHLVNALKQYSTDIYFQVNELVRRKNDAGRFWLDSQYRTFAEFIDEIQVNTMNSLKTFGEYVGYLNQKIKELS